MTNTTTPATYSERAAATILNIPTATLRYYRTKGYLREGLLVDAQRRLGNTQPIQYNADMVGQIAAGELPDVFKPDLRV